MRALIVSDIHGNLHALEAVLAAAGPWDELWNLGDAVGYGAFPNEVIALLRTHAAVNVRGNHDRVCAGLSSSHGFNPVAAQAAAWTEAALTPENLQWLREVPRGPLQAGTFSSCAHGSPIDEDQYLLCMRDAWLPLQRMATPLTFFGHTHVQGAFLANGAEWEEVMPTLEGEAAFTLDIAAGWRALANPGSVGQPRDRDRRAAYAVYDEATGCVRFCRTPYDVAGAQQGIRQAGLPERLATRLETGR